jgi:integrase
MRRMSRCEFLGRKTGFRGKKVPETRTPLIPRLQDCRHTFTSILLSEGASIFFVMKQLGHAGVKLTCNLYGHLLPESRGSAALTD